MSKEITATMTQVSEVVQNIAENTQILQIAFTFNKYLYFTLYTNIKN